MKSWRILQGVFLLLVLVAGGPVVAKDPSKAEMGAAVEGLVKAAKKRTMLWPWSRPLPEVAKVAAYGKAIAPLLVNLLVDDPDALKDSLPEVDWNVQQQVALALCRIYGVTEEAGHVYMNRASREENARVKRFWVDKVYRQ